MKLLRTFLQEDGSYRYEVRVPDLVPDTSPHWEKDRLASMEANLKFGMTLVDVGAELGWQSVIYGRFVGPQNVCLIEPVADLWPAIRETWDLNFDVPPQMTRCVRASNRTYSLDREPRSWYCHGFPRPDLITSWSSVHAAATDADLPELTIDDLAIKPDAITIDVEGGEFRVLKGARRTLAEVRPLVWVSLHPDERLKKYSTSKREIYNWMLERKYSAQYLGVDHEEHWFFYPWERSIRLVNQPWGSTLRRDVNFEELMPDWIDGWKANKVLWGKD